MRKILSIITLFLTFLCFQSAAQKLVISGFVELPTDISAREFEVLDVNDDPCAIVKIYTGLKNIKIDGNRGVEKVEEKDGAFWIWVPKGTRQLKISKDGFAMLPYYFDKELEKSSVYSFELSTDELYSIIISTGSEMAEITINNKKYSSNSTIPKLPAGDYPILISKLGFKSVTDTITVDKENLFFTYSLTRTKQHILVINSEPSRAALTINGQPVGQTNFSGYYFPGQYRIQLSMLDYLPIDTTITFNPDIASNLNFNLVSNVGWINLSVSPQNSSMQINGTKVIPGTLKLNAGLTHEIMAKAPFYRDYSEAFTIQSGDTLKKNIILQPQEGELSFIIEPNFIPIQVTNERGQSANWTGNKVQILPVGKYDMKINQKGYNKLDTAFTINDEQRTNLNLKLTEHNFNRVSAGLLSTLFPGAGQYYTQRNKAGMAYMVSTLALAGAAGYFFQETNKLADEYETAKSNYDSETAVENIPAAREQMVNAYNDYDQAAKTRDMLLYATASVYVLNIIDAVVFAKYHSPSNPKNKLDVGFYSNSKANGIKLAYKF